MHGTLGEIMCAHWRAQEQQTMTQWQTTRRGVQPKLSQNSPKAKILPMGGHTIMAIVSHSRRHSCRVAPLRWCRRDDARRTGARHRMVRAPNYCELSPDYCPTHRTGTELGRYMIRYSNHRHGFGLRVHIRVTRHYRPAPPGKLLRNAPGVT